MTGSNLISPEDKEKLIEIADRIWQLRSRFYITTATLTPLNYLTEMDKFFESNTYNPFFVYNHPELPDVTDEKNRLKQEIKDLTLPEDLSDHMMGIMSDLDQMEITKRSVGTETFSQNAHDLLDWGKDRLDMLLANTPKVKFALYTKHNLQNAQEIKNRFEKVLTSYGITELPVIIDTFSTHMISITSRGIKIGSSVKRYKCNVDRLVVHEIESHALQIANVMRANNKLSYMTKYSNMNLYAEGLAVYNEITTRKITPEAFDMYFNRIRAVHMLDKSFREIFDTLSVYIPPKKAYVITYRVKRGMEDTSKSGGFPKDAAYLLGFHEIENLIAEGYNTRLLYATKSPILSTLLAKYELIDTKTLLSPKSSR